MTRTTPLHKIVCGFVAVSALTASLSFGQETVIKEAAPSLAVANQTPTTDVEVIRERHLNRTIKIEREVIRDADDDYVSHGSWKMWDKDGQLVASGRYRDGLRQGQWTAWFLKDESKLMSQAPFKDFAPPYISKATFNEGELDGTWTIHDDQNRKISEWNYAHGQRNGSWTSWYPNGQKMRQTEFEKGELQGPSTSWAADGKIIREETFESGRRLVNKAEHFAKNAKKSEGVYLLAKQQLAGQDDWWNAKLASIKTVGKDERHGPYKEWYRNGQLRGQGTYANGQPTGLITWWYENGQRSVEGHFDEGQKVSRWTWWHPNGQKSIDGKYDTGAPDGNWIWWSKKGQVAQRVEYSGRRAPETPDSPDAGTGGIENIAQDAKEANPQSSRRVAERPTTATPVR